MKANAEDIQALALGVVQLGRTDPDFREVIIGPPRPEEVRVDGALWFRRHCISVSQAVMAAAEAKGLDGVRLVVGQFQDRTDPEPLHHVWLELGNGTIVDPTSAQMGGPQCAIVPARISSTASTTRGTVGRKVTVTLRDAQLTVMRGASTGTSRARFRRHRLQAPGEIEKAPRLLWNPDLEDGDH